MMFLKQSVSGIGALGDRGQYNREEQEFKSPTERCAGSIPAPGMPV
jgi:hypothetical protein